MAPRKTAAVAEEVEEEASTEEPRSIFDTLDVTTKAGVFKFREMDGDKYDETVELARDPETKRVDMVQLLRWLTVESSSDGRVKDAGQLNKLPYSVRNKILAQVNDFYFPDETGDLVERLQSMGYTVESPQGNDSPNS